MLTSRFDEQRRLQINEKRAAATRSWQHRAYLHHDDDVVREDDDDDDDDVDDDDDDDNSDYDDAGDEDPELARLFADLGVVDGGPPRAIGGSTEQRTRRPATPPRTARGRHGFGHTKEFLRPTRPPWHSGNNDENGNDGVRIIGVNRQASQHVTSDWTKRSKTNNGNINGGDGGGGGAALSCASNGLRKTQRRPATAAASVGRGPLLKLTHTRRRDLIFSAGTT
jgi:hypothetical protein